MTFPPLAPLGTAALTVDGLVDQVVATRALVNALHAHEMSLLAAASGLVQASADPGGADLPMRSLSAELGAAMHVGDRTVQRQLSEASVLVEQFPATHAAVASGAISRAHASVIVDAGWHIADPGVRAAYEASVIAYAREETVARLRPVARLRAERVAPSSLQERHDRARMTRGVRVFDLADGMSELIATLPSVLAHGAYDRLTTLAHEVRDAASDDAEDAGVDQVGGASADDDSEDARVEPGSPESESESDSGSPSGSPVGQDRAAAAPGEARADAVVRSMDELRADILADLMLAADPAAHEVPTGLAGIRAQVQVVVPVLTLLNGACDPDDETGAALGGPVELAGHGPVDADTARRLAGHAPGWDRVLTHPITGAVLAVDRYRPSEEIKRALRVRDRHCRFVGCRRPVHHCDLDHTLDAALGGPTTACNLAHLCRRHHILKHHTAWTVRQLAEGVLEWTSPTGRIYTDRPVSAVAFAPIPEPVAGGHDPGRDPRPGSQLDPQRLSRPDPPPF
jgi:hypothetical protein